MVANLGKPNFFDRAIGLFSPRQELKRILARQALAEVARTYEGSSHGRRTRNWIATNQSINSLIAGSMITLRARARYLSRNNGYAKKAVATIVSNTIGDGIIPQARSQSNESTAKSLDDLWINWGDETDCDSDGLLDFYGLQALAFNTIVDSGSCLIRRRPRRMSDGLAVPLQIQLLEPDFLDHTRDRLLENGGRILQGVEYDKLGRRVAYHLFKEHPGDRLMMWNGVESNRVDAADIIHLFRVDRIGQADGVPWGAPNIIKVKDLDEYDDAELMRQKIAACFAGFIHDIEALDDSPTTSPKCDLERVEPGILEVLPPGKTITFGAPPPSTGGGQFTDHLLRSIAAGYGCTYEAMTGDYSKVNFSSARMGNIEYQRSVRQWQNHIVIAGMCKGVWRWFNEAAMLAGEVDAIVPAIWTPPRREMIDPVKETEALKAQVRCGFMSQSEAIAQGGRDPDTVLAEIAATNKKIDEDRLKLDTDPRSDAGIPAPSGQVKL